MPGRIRSVTGHRRESLASGWEIASSVPGLVENPQSDALASLSWKPIDTLGTVAAALRASSAWNLDDPARRFDAEDWWYRLRFKAAPAGAGEQTLLCFDGLATVADAWLNGRAILSSDNMFVSHEIPVDEFLKGDNELVLRFRSLDALLTARRPRPRWRTPMIEQQQLRWFRTTLLGRTPGWSPPAAAVGPWRPIRLEIRKHFSLGTPTIRTSVNGSTGIVEIECEMASIGGTLASRADFVASRGGKKHAVTLARKEKTDVFSGRLEIANVDLWWPHTHGEPALYDARLRMGSIEVDLGRIGFRTVALDAADGNFSLQVNGVPVFCRGACWTPLDCVSLQADKQTTDAAIAQAAAAGMNMLRVGGTMVYENDDFLDACDAHGILLWQDFMFANMDYPEGDVAFDASVQRETAQLLHRLSGRPCLTVLCGNSEGEQQAAMWGAPRERWSHPLFHKLLPQQTSALAPGTPYWPSSAHGGAFPHQGNSGTTSYYGVGAYRRPLTDARRAEIRFATECLAFANVPEEQTLASLPGGPGIKVHHPQWKARSPRDLGAGWDFDDIRDHYFADIFSAQTLDLRYADHERYLQLSRVVSGEAMAAAFREWRRQRSTCNGALIWFLRDLWPGAGWGIVDATGLPKAPYYFLRRILQPRSVFLSDEGGNGLFAHLTNETAQALQACLEISLYRSGEIPVGNARHPVTIPARAALELPVASLFDGFMDMNHAYRFGPPTCDLVVATLTNEQGEVLARDFHFPTGQTLATEPDVGLAATALPLPDGDAEVLLQTKRLARFVTVRTEGFAAEDQYFHLAPGMQHRVRLRRLASGGTVKGEVYASNSQAVCKIALPK